MPRKVMIWGAVAIAAFYLISSPASAGGTVRQAGSAVSFVGHQLAVFLKAIG